MEYLAVLAPSIVVGLLFWFVMRSILRADKSERQAEAQAQREAEMGKTEPHEPPSVNDK